MGKPRGRLTRYEKMSPIKTSKIQNQIIRAVTFGNVLEWFEIYIFAYMSHVLSEVFFNFKSALSNQIGVFVVFGIGLFSRIVGAVIFGRMGDKLGRRKSFLTSIVALILPTFALGCLPTYADVGIYAAIFMMILRVCQTIPAAGEAPGAFCFLYEYANASNRKYMTSWGAFGNQIGAILGLTETILMESYASHEFLLAWGWRITFWTGSIIGLFGFYLRKKLHETPEFQELKKSQSFENEKVYKQKRRIFLGMCYGAINASTYYLIAIYLPTYLMDVLKLNEFQSAIISIVILILTTVFLPAFGILGQKYRSKPIFISCTLVIIFLLWPFYVAVENRNSWLLGIIGFLYMIPITCMTALLPNLLNSLFPTSVRFRGMSLSFNLADGMIGGLTPAIALTLFRLTGNETSFCWFILLCAVISLISYFKIRE